MTTNKVMAKKTGKALKTPVKQSKYKIRTKLRFHRGPLKKTEAGKRYVRKLSSVVKKQTTLNPSKVLIQPVSSDKNMTKMENNNTITFLVDQKANKNMIKEAFKKLYNAKVQSVNTLNTPNGKKKAYIRLSGEGDALNIASKIGIL
jgi:large subunit ribosomal protein L23Ae